MCLDLSLVFLYLFLLLNKTDPVLLKVAYQVLKALLLLRDMLPCFLNDVIPKPQSLGYRKGVTLARNTYKQSIGRRQCLNIEFAAGILHMLRTECIDLKLTVMCGCHRPDSPAVQMVKNGNRKRRSLRRVRTRAKLVEQAQTV